jgi:hypothetical protein
VDDRNPAVIDHLCRELWGKLFGDRGYISRELFERLYRRGIKLITRLKRNMKNNLMDMGENVLLRKPTGPVSLRGLSCPRADTPYGCSLQLPFYFSYPASYASSPDKAILFLTGFLVIRHPPFGLDFIFRHHGAPGHFFRT